MLLVTSCQDVIEVDVPNTTPRLVIDASLNWFEGTSGDYQNIKLSLSAPFFNGEVPAATGANVMVTDQNNVVFTFLDTNSNGVYECFNFIPQLNQEYTLTIDFNNETYVGTEIMSSVSPIDYVEQSNDGGFTGEDIEIKAFYTDPFDQENYYFFEFIEDGTIIPDLNVYDDEFTNGNQIFAYYSNEDSEIGNELIIRNYGVSRQFFEFMSLLLQQTSEGGGPFEVQPATVRGNCINQTNPGQFPFGYFRASQASEIVYIIE